MDSQGTTSDRDRASVRFYRLGDEPLDDLTSNTTPEERLGLLRELSDRAWRLTGREVPSYARSEAPVLVTRLG